MGRVIIYLIMFQVVLSFILYLCIVLKWYILKPKIEANSWYQTSPCGVQTLLNFLIPVYGPLSCLAAMSILDEAAQRTKAEAENLLGVQIGPMVFTFSEQC
ncbi:MAG TPA: hypothetical protein DCF49_05845 [Lachnospiraceae bacterium]|nr:hypothetical protein [Lachnospiraceae bacterium]